MLKTAFIDQNW